HEQASQVGWGNNRIVAHECASSGRGLLTPTAALHRAVSGGLRTIPVDALDVVIHLRRQGMPAPLAASLQDGPAGARLHALAEAMHPHAAVNFGLVGTFCHDVLSYFTKKQGHFALCCHFTKLC